MRITGLAAVRPSARLPRVFNLFRRKEMPDLFFAVPEDRSVPDFIAGDDWEFGGRLAPACDAPPPGFHVAAAEIGARLNGFYMFHVHAREQDVSRTRQ